MFGIVPRILDISRDIFETYRYQYWEYVWDISVRWQGGDTEYPLAGLPISLVHGGYSLKISEDVVEKQLYYSQSRDASDDAALARLFLW